MRKFFAFLFIFLLVAAGAGYLLYPTISDQIGQANDAAVMLTGPVTRRFLLCLVP